MVAAQAAGHSDVALPGFLLEAVEYHRLRRCRELCLVISEVTQLAFAH